MQPNIIVSSHVVAVPYIQAKSYFKHEIQSEGQWRDEVPLITYSPKKRIGNTTSEDIQWIFDSMELVRKQNPPKRVRLNNFFFYIGLMDILVHVGLGKGISTEAIESLLAQDPAPLIQANGEHVDQLAKGEIHDQMVIVNASHCFDKQGGTLIHFHNVIFGLQVEEEKIRPLDFKPLIAALSQDKHISLAAPANSPFFN